MKELDSLEKLAAAYIASLKTLVVVHQHGHWNSQGESFYEDHLLLERIYDTSVESLDGAAEKFIGLMGSDLMDFCFQACLVKEMCLKYKSCEDSGEFLKASYLATKDFLNLSKELYDEFKTQDKLSLGLDDFIMATASAHEESCYLLKRALGLT